MAEEKATPKDTAPEPETTPPVADEPTTPEKAEMTQAEVDRIVKERLARERAKYADYDQLKAAAAELEKIRESQLSETEKLQKKLAEIEEAREKAERTAQETLMRSAIIAEAARLNFNDPDDAYALVDRGLLTIEDGEVKGVKEAVTALAEQRKYLIKSGSKPLAAFEPTGEGGPVKETDAQRRARIYGGGGDIFDATIAERLGGGVRWGSDAARQKAENTTTDKPGG